ncbi:MAG: hypothetical protein E7268_08440 [Lachnospiraceae bacterium]|nr:hypothetical protein [Lachnospiraceae bacterium]
MLETERKGELRLKHIFVLNPNAGHGTAQKELEDKLSCTSFDWKIYTTVAAGDSVRFIREWCETHPEPVRFYACGGDGTIHEVANAIYGYPQASISCYPVGSGNDFVKYYGGKERFSDPVALCSAPEESIDLIRVNDYYAINACHFGLDSCVASMMDRLRHKKILGGKRAYPISVLYAFFKGMRHKATITADDELLCNSDFLLCTAANGTYVGGSYRCAPRSSNTDGYMELCLVRRISRLRFLSVINKYKAGSHLDDPSLEKFIIYRRCKTMKVTAPKGFFISLDGEVKQISEFTAEIVPSAIRFAVPEKK